MRFMRRLISGILAIIACTCFAWADPVAQVVKLIGSVQVTRGQVKAALVLGAALEPGDRLNTDAGSRVQLQLIDGSTINLGSQSEFSIDDVVSQGPGTERQVGLDLWLGVLRAFAAPATPKSRFEIRTPKAITAVRGTQWGIYSLATQSDIVVLDGRVGVRKNVVSAESAISITGKTGITVTDEGLGPTTRWDPERIAALIAATDVSGPEQDFDLNQAPALDLDPAGVPPQPQESPEEPEKAEESCIGEECQESGGASKSRDSDGGESGGESDSDGGESDSGSGW